MRGAAEASLLLAGETVNRQAFHITGAVVLTFAFVGFFTGVERPSQRASLLPARGASSIAPPAPGYADLRSIRRGPNAEMYAGGVAIFEANLPRVLEEVPPQTERERAHVLAARAERRAYDGAPPTIPHAIRQEGPPDCLGCHEKGAIVTGKRAPAMSHARFDSCTQCHVPAGNVPAPPPPPLTDNGFVGAMSPARGERAWPGAPPTIPHPTAMRTSCGSCHGVSGALGMRSTHPWRESCTQCHAPSASLDQRAPREAPLPPRGTP